MSKKSLKNLANGLLPIASVIETGRQFFDGKNKSHVRNIPYHSGLAAQYGTLTSDTIKAMDDKLKVAIAGTNRLMIKLQQDKVGTEIPFADYLAAMNQSVLLEKKKGSDIFKADALTFVDVHWFKFDGSPEEEKVRQVWTWFANLIGDADILKDTQIELKDFANMVAETGVAVKDFDSFVCGTDHYKKTVIDVGILRYPDPDHPFFKLYRIKISAFRKVIRILAIQGDEAGIDGEFQCVQFVPRQEVLREMKADVFKKAVGEAESLFE